jgi:hypothetical protein
MSPITKTQHSLAPTPADSSAPMPNRGRPTTFDEPKRHEFCSLLRLGCTVSKAAALVGISRRGVLYAAKRDPDLAERIRVARQESEIAALRNIQAASSKSWRAAAWLLERGRRQPRRKSAAASLDPKKLLKSEELRRELFDIVKQLLPRAEQSNLIDNHIAAHQARLQAVVNDIKARRDRGEDVDAAAELRRHFPRQFSPNGN